MAIVYTLDGDDSGRFQIALDTSVTPNVYRVTVKASLRSSVGARSIIVRATDDQTGEYVGEPFTLTVTPGTPAAPTLTASAGNNSTTLTWVDGANAGSAITAHNIYRGTVSGTRTLIGQITTASPYIDTGLTNGTQYFYTLSAVNGQGEGPQSAEVSATPTGYVVMNIASNGMVPHRRQQVSGALTRQRGRRQYKLAVGVTSLQVFFDNWYLTNVTTSASETDNTSPITFQKVAVSYNGTTAPITFAGARGATMAAGASQFATDELTTQALFGVASIPAGAIIDVRWMIDVPASGYFVCTDNRDFSSAEYVYTYDPTATGNSTDDVDGVGVMAAQTTGGSGTGVKAFDNYNTTPYFFKPTMLGGRPNATFPSGMCLGDSLADGLNDSPGDGSAACIAVTVFGGGWVRRAFQNANHAFMICGLSGRSLGHYVANRTKSVKYMRYHNYGFVELVGNDINIGDSASNIQNNRRTAYADFKANLIGGKKVFQSTMGTVASSTDKFTTTANQTPAAGYASGGLRDTVNTAIIADVGTNNLDNYIDVRPAQDDATDNHKWRVIPISKTKATTTLAAALTGASSRTVSLTDAPDVGTTLYVNPLAAGGNAAYLMGTVMSVTGNGPYTCRMTTFVSTTQASGALVTGLPTQDGTHNEPSMARDIAADASVANSPATVLAAITGA